MNDEQPLTKRERRLQRKQEKREARERAENSKKIRKIGLIVLVLLAIGFGGYRLFGGGRSSSSKDSVNESGEVGEVVADLGRNHVTDISGVEYNSNPPTSGTHFPVWAKKGVYSGVLSDGHLIHSLEHGYIVVSYNCTRLQISNFQFPISNVYAHEGDDVPADLPHPVEASGSGEVAPLNQGGVGNLLPRMVVGLDGAMSFFNPNNPPPDEIELPESFSSGACEELKGELNEFFENNKRKRLIIVPRINLDVPVAMTAWTRILKLEEWDGEMAQEFVRRWENRGPEQTAE